MNISSTVNIIAAFILVVAWGGCAKNNDNAKPDDVDYYTCTMHPSVRSQDPHGKCPICGMDLTPVKKKTAAAAPDAEPHPAEFTVAVERQQQIGVTYGTVEIQPLKYHVRTVGMVAYDEGLHWDYSARVDGYAQKMNVFSPGELVRKGATLMTLYSPTLFTAEKELLDAVRMRGAARAAGSEDADQLVNSGQERLRLWNLSDSQIADLEKTGKPKDEVDLLSPLEGVVQKIDVRQGRHVSVGDSLLSIVGLHEVWVWAQFYEEDLPALAPDLPVIITTSSYPGDKFSGKISLINPFLDDATRTVRVRIDVENPDVKLRPEMYVDADLSVDKGRGLTIPAGAILPTGLHNIAFIDKGGGKLEPRYVELGRKYGDYYEVKSGVKENERVVTSANFLVDAEAKVQGALQSW